MNTIPIYYESPPGAQWVTISHNGETLQAEIYQGNIQIWDEASGHMYEVVNDDFLVDLLTGLGRQPIPEALEEAQHMLRELVTVWGNAPQRAKHLLICIEGKLSSVVADLSARSKERA